jgi:hypothetical protein
MVGHAQNPEHVRAIPMKHCTPTSFFSAILILSLPAVALADPAATPPPLPENAPAESADDAAEAAADTAPEAPPDAAADRMQEPIAAPEPSAQPSEEAVPVTEGPHVDLPPEEDGPALDLPPEDDQKTLSPRNRVLGQGMQVGTTNIGGYGEMHYNAVMPESGPNTNEVDFHRLVLYVGRQFNDDLSFYSEIEVEHAIVGDGKVGEVAVEQAYIDYRLSEHVPILGDLTLRTGIVLVPMGIVNQWHEPPIFHGVERPNVDKVIIPSTWREGGIGLVGKPHDQVQFELYVMSGLDPLSFSRSSGIRGGRQKGGEARTDGLAFSGRAEFYPDATSVIGVSGYFSQSGKNNDAIDANVPVLGVSADVRGKYEGLEARAEFAMFTIGDTDELNALMDVDGNALVSVADRLVGGFAEVAYDVLYTLDTEKQLLPFGRFEYYDTDADDDTRSITDIVLGLSYKPIPQVIFKQDVTIRRKGGGVDGDNATILNLGIGFLY